MPPRRQTQVMGEMDRMAGQALGRVTRQYRKGVIGPLVGRIKKAGSLRELLNRLGPGLLKEMDSREMETALHNTGAQAGMIGRVSARPKKRLKDEERKKSS